jgi:hypothetical protein
MGENVDATQEESLRDQGRFSRCGKGQRQGEGNGDVGTFSLGTRSAVLTGRVIDSSPEPDSPERQQKSREKELTPPPEMSEEKKALIAQIIR